MQHRPAESTPYIAIDWYYGCIYASDRQGSLGKLCQKLRLEADQEAVQFENSRCIAYFRVASANFDLDDVSTGRATRVSTVRRRDRRSRNAIC